MSEIDPASLLFRPIKNPRHLARLSPDRHDSVSRIIPRNDRRLRAPNSESREDHIQRRLGHISSNPSDPTNSPAIKLSYVFNGIDEYDEYLRRPLYVNRDYEASATFVGELISAAKEQHELGKMTAVGGGEVVHATQRMFILHGPR